MTLEDAVAASGLPRLEAQALAAHALGTSSLQAIVSARRQLSAVEEQTIAAHYARRRRGEPVAYIVSAREFFSLQFGVTPAVLIPRAETEHLVEFALERIAPGVPSRMLDLGTGSGCIAISVAMHRPRALITAVDSDAAALAVARANVQWHGVANVELLQSDWFAALGGRRFDLIVANPPYVRTDDVHLTQGDVRFEPRSALIAGDDGLACMRAIVAVAHQFLAEGGWLAFEHGYDQAGSCRDLLATAGLCDILTRRDLAGIERISGGRVALQEKS